MAKKSTTFKGQAKPYGQSGHFHEPMRHSLQARGIKTGHFSSLGNGRYRYQFPDKGTVTVLADSEAEAKDKILEKVDIPRSFLDDTDGDGVSDAEDCDPLDPTKQDEPLYFSEKYWSLKRDEEGNLRLTLGNLTDAGWFWDGDNEELAGFLVRLHGSKAKDQFLQTMKKSGVDFKEFKDDLKKAVQSGDGVYMLTGDNVKWHFGEDGEELYERVDMMARDKGLDDVEKDALADKVFDQEYNGTDFDVFKKSYHYDDVKKGLLDATNKSNTWSQFFDNIEQVKEDAREESWEFTTNQGWETADKGWEDYLESKKKDPQFQEMLKMKKAETNPAQKRMGDY